MFYNTEIGLTLAGQILLALMWSATYLSSVHFLVNTHRNGRHSKTSYPMAALQSLAPAILALVIDFVLITLLPEIAVITLNAVIPVSYILWGRN